VPTTIVSRESESFPHATSRSRSGGSNSPQRIKRSGRTLPKLTHRETVAAHGVPYVSHEIGQWCVYPNFDEIPKYTGVLKPKNFEIFRGFLLGG